MARIEVGAETCGDVFISEALTNRFMFWPEVSECAVLGFSFRCVSAFKIVFMTAALTDHHCQLAGGHLALHVCVPIYCGCEFSVSF